MTITEEEMAKKSTKAAAKPATKKPASSDTPFNFASSRNAKVDLKQERLERAIDLESREAMKFLNAREKKLVTLQTKHPNIDICNGNAPFPGHTKLFAKAFSDSLKATRKAGGLKSFGVIDYCQSKMSIACDLATKEMDTDWAAEGAVDDIVAAAAKASAKTCALCGKPARLSKRYTPHDAPVALCAVHTEYQIEILLEEG